MLYFVDSHGRDVNKRNGIREHGRAFYGRKIMTALSTKALRMIRGKGENAVTCYSCGVVRQAKRDGVKVLVVRRNRRTGKKEEVAVQPRLVDRGDIRATFGDSHELAGQGKFIALKAYPKGDRSRVTGAQHINPYLRNEGAYATIVETLKHDIGVIALSRLRGSIHHGRNPGTHILWSGRRNSDDFLVASDWFTKEELWDMSCEFNGDLLRILRKSKSGVKGASHKSAKDKFFGNLDVLRRATCVVSVTDGEKEYCGGATPYSKPLEQVGFAIDKRFLTYGVGIDGEEVGQYYYRLVIGRSEPHVLNRSHWKYEGITSTVAFKDDSARKAVRMAS